MIEAAVRDCSVAVLMVGLAGASLDEHLLATRRSVLVHNRSAVFAVSEAGEASSLARLPATLGTFLHTLGLVGDERLPRPSWLPARVSFAAIEPPRQTVILHTGVAGQGGWPQWHKVREAWRLMEAAEERSGAQFDVVVKLRFDCTPLETLRLCPSPRSEPLLLRAATDKAFWGPRAAMAVATRMHDGLPLLLDTEGRTDPLRRVVPVRLMLRAALSLPDAAWSAVKSVRQHYNKVAMLPFPTERVVARKVLREAALQRVNKARPAAQKSTFWKQGAKAALTEAAEAISATSARRLTVEQLRRALAAGFDTLDPLALPAAATTTTSRGVAPTATKTQVQHGLSAGRNDVTGRFVAERDFLTWLFAHNVSVCGLGAVDVLYKGVRWTGASAPCAPMPEMPPHAAHAAHAAHDAQTAHAPHAPHARHSHAQLAPAVSTATPPRARSSAASPSAADGAPRPAPAAACRPGSLCCEKHPRVPACQSKHRSLGRIRSTSSQH